MSNLISADYLEVVKAEVKRTLDQAENYLDTANPNIIRVNKLIEHLDDAYDMFNKEYSTITKNHYLNVVKVEDYENWSKEQITYKIHVDAKLTLLWDRQKTLIAPSAPPVPTVPTPTTPKIKYPEISLVKFYGDKTKWDAWWQGFTSMVHSKKELDRVTKFTYLLGTLEGESKRTVERFEVTESGYDLAIQALTDKYSDPDASKSILVCKLTDIKAPSANRQELEEFKENYLAYSHKLELLGVKVSDAEWWLKVHLLRKLPKVVVSFIQDKADTIYPDISEILEYLTLYVKRNLTDKQQDVVSPSKEYLQKPPWVHKTTEKSKSSPWKGKKSSQAHSVMEKSSDRSYNCIFCQGQHSPRKCDVYTTRPKRVERLKTLQRCVHCCRSHPSEKCPNELQPCYQCQGKHHTWLCVNVVQAKSKDEAVKTKVAWQSNKSGPNGALPTATVIISKVSRRARGKGLSTRCFFDQGAQRSFISKTIVERLRLPTTNSIKLELTSFGGHTEEKNYPIVQVSVLLGSRAKRISAVVIDKLPNNINTPGLTKTAKHLARRHELADKHLQSDIVTGIDLVIGADHYGRFITGLSQKSGIDVLQSSGGLVIYGPIPLATGSPINVNHVSVYNLSVHSSPLEIESNQDLTPRMWDLTNMGISPDEQSVSDDVAYKLFLKTVKYEDNKYWVRLPWRTNAPSLPNNYQRARSQCLSLLNKLRRKPETLAHYGKILNQQLELGFIESCGSPNPSHEAHHYLPHFPVEKDSDTTPIRLVYDASSKSHDGVSLNDCLMRGPNLTKVLCDSVLRMRRENYAYSADISKAFLRLGLQEVDRDFTRFLWPVDPTDPNSPLQVYRFKSVLFGATSSPFLLQVTLDLHLRTSTGQYWEEILRNFYVDNLLGSVDDEEKLINIYGEANRELKEADMPLNSWATNSPALTEIIKVDTGLPVPFKNTQNMLGMNWSIDTDSISLKSVEPVCIKFLTKRVLLSRVSSLFDPLGLLSPLQIQGKLLVQQAHSAGVGWDVELPAEIGETWPEIENSLAKAGDFSFPRSAYSAKQNPTLHIFVDASSRAYGACAYVLCDNNTTLLMSKAKVAPSKPTRTLPQLELMALLVGARLARYIVKTLDQPFSSVHLWSDNEAVIQWVRNDRSQKTFVQNRVAEIRELTSDIPIRHVPTKRNPADLLTRGITPEVLHDTPLWFQGPDWLLEESEWPVQKSNLVASLFVEAALVVPVETAILPAENYSSLNKLVSITRIIFKFLNIKAPNLKLPQPVQYWVRDAQRKYYPEVFKILDKQVTPTKNNPSLKFINDLGLYEDGKGVLRSRGRLHHANVPEPTKYPMLLPPKSHIAKLIVFATHEWTLHSGVQQVLTSIRQWCWLPKGRQTVKTQISRCTLCRRFESRQIPRPGPPVLPIERVLTSRPFQNTGVDYTGAITVRSGSTGECRKVYVALFTCMVTRAIHLEIANDLSAETFLHVFRRFAAVCSLPETIVSDHGTNLSAMAKFLREIYSENKVQRYMDTHHVIWKFIHVGSPWEGGFYERLIGVTKSCLMKQLYRQTLSDQELITLLAEVTARVNNRPLTYVNEEHSLLSSLTPSHLVCGRSIVTMPPLETEDDLDPSYEIDQRVLHQRFSRLSKLLRKFEDNYEKEYLTALRARHYGNNRVSQSPPLQEGDVVIIEAGPNREKWPLGRVLKLLPDPDGIVRAVRVQSKGRESVVTMEKMVPLEIQGPAPPRAPEEVGRPPVPPDEPPERATRPRRAAAQRATRLNRQIFERNSSDEESFE